MFLDICTPSLLCSERMRKMSEDSEFSGEDDDEDESRSGQGNFGGFTSTVCVNFSQDDLRLATIPGQEGVSTVTVTLILSHCHSRLSQLLMVKTPLCFNHARTLSLIFIGYSN